MKLKKLALLIIISILFGNASNFSGYFTIARIHYSGGGDWYADPSSLPNLLQFVSENTSIKIRPEEVVVKIGDEAFFEENYFYMTGHGNINLNNEEVVALRQQLLSGSFLHADDNYGMDKSFRTMIKKVFPDNKLVELSPEHEIFNIYYTFSEGLPKIHTHDNKRPQAFGLFHNDKLILLYTYESDLGDGWEDVNVHKVPEYKKQAALRMGTNIITYFLLN